MKKAVIILLSLLIVILITLGVINLYLATNKIDISLKGKDKITLEVFSDFKDEGITVKRGKKILSKKKYKLKVDSNVKLDTLGNYKIIYKVIYHKKTYKLNRIVEVVDTTKPILTINTNEIEKDYCTKKINNNLEIKAIDNYDKDITDKIEATEFENKVIYKIADSSGNEDIKEINIKYSEKPNNKFILNGKSKISISLNGTYQELGATYLDGCGNKIDKEIKITGNVDTAKVGNYTVTYEVEGEKSLMRNVNVYEVTYEPKTIYLTFDDGPGLYTRNILDTLAKYNVKATFFVTNQFPGYSYLITEEKNQGHSIAVHTYTHQYGAIYTSVDAYIDDFNKMNDIIKEKTGSYSNMFRFPGGSSNTVSRNYKIGVVSEIASEMTNRGYVYFDWNLSSGDAAGYNSNKIYNSVVNGVEHCNPCVVLMHDIKKTTANALDPILDELTSRGYIFKTLNESSPTVHHKINN